MEGEDASLIEFVTGRVKPITSIIDKANKRGIPFDDYVKRCTTLLVLE